MADGGYKNVPVTISGSYDNQKEGTYRLSVISAGVIQALRAPMRKLWFVHTTKAVEIV